MSLFELAKKSDQRHFDRSAAPDIDATRAGSPADSVGQAPKRHKLLLLALLMTVLVYLLPPPAQPGIQRGAFTGAGLANANSAGSAAPPLSPTVTPIEKMLIEVRRNDTLSTLFSRAGIAAQQLSHLMGSAEAAEPLKTIYPGETLVLHRQSDALVRIDYQPDSVRTWVIEPKGDTYAGRWEHRALETRISERQININHSMYRSALDAGLSESLILQVADIFGWDIDFALDVRRGDQVSVIYETLWGKEDKGNKGAYVRDGDVLAARFINKGQIYEALRYQRPDGSFAYYDREGRSMHKKFLRSPVDFRRISSGFRAERWHPVLGIKRPHRGVDYAAAPGTPVRVTADGKLAMVGKKGGYGRTVIVSHGQGNQTLYAHLKAYAKGLKPGQAVTQGQVIGYVGSSGVATGPHLHYEFLVNGTHRNPLTVKLPDAAPLSASERLAFAQQTAGILAQLDGGRGGQKSMPDQASRRQPETLALKN